MLILAFHIELVHYIIQAMGIKCIKDENILKKKNKKETFQL